MDNVLQTNQVTITELTDEQKKGYTNRKTREGWAYRGKREMDRSPSWILISLLPENGKVELRVNKTPNWSTKAQLGALIQAAQIIQNNMTEEEMADVEMDLAQDEPGADVAPDLHDATGDVAGRSGGDSNPTDAPAGRNTPGPVRTTEDDGYADAAGGES